MLMTSIVAEESGPEYGLDLEAPTPDPKVVDLDASSRSRSRQWKGSSRLPARSAVCRPTSSAPVSSLEVLTATGILLKGSLALSNQWFTLAACPKLTMSSRIPVDFAASDIVGMRRIPSDMLHFIHPKPAQWSDLLKPLLKVLDVPLLPYVEWSVRLEASARDADEDSPATINQRAALRLTHFYRIALGASKHHTESGGLLAKVASEEGHVASPALQAEDISRLGRADVDRWVAYWREIGFLPS